MARSRVFRSALSAAVAASVLTVPLWVSSITAASAATPASGPVTYGPEAVSNPSGATNTTGWTAGSNLGTVTTSRVTGITGVTGATTAVQLSRPAASGSNWAYATSALTAPTTFFVPGRTYRVQVLARETDGQQQNITLTAANSGFAHQPGAGSTAVQLTSAWTTVSVSILATTRGSSDTALYLGLPPSLQFTMQFTLASITEAVPMVPAGPEAVQNPSAATNASGWSSQASTGTLTTTQVSGVSGPFPATTGVQVSRATASSATFALTLAALNSPATFFVAGHTYRYQVWAKETDTGAAQPITLQLANAAYQHQPSTDSISATPGSAWTLVSHYFVATQSGSSDTALYLGLPPSAAFTFQFTQASVQEVVAPSRTRAEAESITWSPAATVVNDANASPFVSGTTGQAAQLANGATASASIITPAATDVVVRARAVTSGTNPPTCPTAPTLAIKVDGTAAGTGSVTSTTWAPTIVASAQQGGTHTIAVTANVPSGCVLTVDRIGTQNTNAALPIDKGVNLTNWFQVSSAAAINMSMVTLTDFQNLASLGVDTVRLPIDFPAMATVGAPYTLDPTLLADLDTVIGWANQTGITVIIDNHPANYTNAGDPHTNWTSSASQAQLTAIWTQLATRYRFSPHVMYDVLNEPNDTQDTNDANSLNYKASDAWNARLGAVIATIRSIDADTPVIAEGWGYGGLGGDTFDSTWDRGLESMTALPTTDVIYSFHDYEPSPLTHQGADWAPGDTRLSNITWPYVSGQTQPVPAGYPAQGNSDEQVEYNKLQDWANEGTAAYLDSRLKIATTFASGVTHNLTVNHRLWVYAGEFGVIVKAPQASRVAWYGQLRQDLAKYGIPWTQWDYRDNYFNDFTACGKAFPTNLNAGLIGALGYNIPAGISPACSTNPSGTGPS